MDVTYRLELPEDYAEVEKLTFAAFETMELPGRTRTNEHFLAHLLRDDPWFIPELDMVAERGSELVGSIFYSKSKVLRSDGTSTDVITFGPVSVWPNLHGQGIGSALIRHSLERARELGFTAVLITGHPTYYPRFGFRPASDFGLTFEDGTSHEAFMALEMTPGVLDSNGGRWKCAKAFDIVESDEEAFRRYIELVQAGM